MSYRPLYISFALLLCLLPGLVHAATYDSCTPEDAYALWQSGAYFVDVRYDHEVAEGYIPGAHHIDVNVLAAQIGELNGLQDSDVVVYCKAGARGATAAGILTGNGFTVSKVHNIVGGFDAWKANCYETEIPLSGYAAIGLQEALDAYGNSTYFLDTRSASAYAIGHVPEATNIELNDLASRLNELTGMEDTDIVVYHDNCLQSDDAAVILADNGFNLVFEMPKGYEGWVEAGYITDPEGGALPPACSSGTTPATRAGDAVLILLLSSLFFLPSRKKKIIA